MIRNDADREAIRVMRTELRRLEDYIAHCACTVWEAYSNACLRAIELRKRLGLPEVD